MVHVIVHSYTHRANLGIIILFSLFSTSRRTSSDQLILRPSKAQTLRLVRKGKLFSGLLVAASSWPLITEECYKGDQKQHI